jgi:hypothetical protein
MTQQALDDLCFARASVTLRWSMLRTRENKNLNRLLCSRTKVLPKLDLLPEKLPLLDVCRGIAFRLSCFCLAESCSSHCCCNSHQAVPQIQKADHLSSWTRNPQVRCRTKEQTALSSNSAPWSNEHSSIMLAQLCY